MRVVQDVIADFKKKKVCLIEVATQITDDLMKPEVANKINKRYITDFYMVEIYRSMDKIIDSLEHIQNKVYGEPK